MSKADGALIAIQFDSELISDPSGMIPAPVGGYAYKPQKILAATASGYYSSYAPSRTIDGSLSTYWWVAASSGWIQFQLARAVAVDCMNWYVDAQPPKNFKISGSNDGSSFTELYSGTSGSGAGWKTFTFENETAYLCYRVNVSSVYSSYIILYEVELCKYAAVGNEQAFSVTAQEYDYTPGGLLVATGYTVDSVCAHPTQTSSILLKFSDYSRFINAANEITVSYDNSKGNLAGHGGPAPSFSVSFYPEGLVAKPNPHDPERMEIALVSPTGTLTRIFYSDTTDAEKVGIAAITPVGTLIRIDDL